MLNHMDKTFVWTTELPFTPVLLQLAKVGMISTYHNMQELHYSRNPDS